MNGRELRDGMTHRNAVIPSTIAADESLDERTVVNTVALADISVEATGILA